MLKKGLYIVMSLLIVFFIYNVYIKKDSNINLNFIKESIETDNIKYSLKKGYDIFAKSLIENKQDEKTYFKMAKAFFNDMQIDGNESIIDKYKNMLFKGNIIGKSADGWQFYTDELKFDSQREKYYSTGKVKAVNKGKKVNVVGDFLEANRDFTIVTVYGNVKLLSENVNLTTSRVTYDRTRNLVRLNDNISFVAKDFKTKNGKVDKISGVMNYGVYDLNQKLFTVWGKYTIYYLGYVIKADNLTYYAQTGNMNANENATIEKDGAVIKLSSAFYNNAQKLITLTGPITGTMDIYNFKADYGEVETEKENVKLSNNIILYTDENRVNADELIYEGAKDTLYINSKYQPNITLNGSDYKVITKRAEFKVGANTLIIPEPYEGYWQESVIKGKSATFNTQTQKGTTYNVDMKKENNTFYADVLDFDLGTKRHNFKRNIKAVYGDYTIKTNSVIFDEGKMFVNINDKFTVENKKENLKVESQDGFYYEDTKDFKTEHGIKVFKDDYVITSKNASYNLDTEEGKLEKNVIITGKKDGSVAKTETILYKAGEYCKAPDKINVTKDGNTIHAENGVYDIIKDIAYSKLSGIFDNAKDKMVVHYKDVTYDRNAGKIRFNEFVGKKEDIDFSSDYAVYDEKTRIFTMEQNAKVVQKTTVVTAERFIYYRDNGDVTSDKPIFINDNNLHIKMEKGILNTVSKTMEGSKVTVTSDEGDRLTGDNIDGNYYTKEFNFTGNLKAKLKEGAAFTGKLAKMFFVEDRNKDYQITRGEIKQDTTFKYKDMDMKSDYLELDNMKRMVFGKGNPVLKLDLGTDLTAQYIYLNMNDETGMMQNGVKITNKSTDTGVVNTLADKAFLKNKEKKVEMSGNVQSYQGDTKVEADKGVYDILTQQMKGEGNIKFKFNVDAGKEKADQIEKQKKDEKNSTTKSAVTTTPSGTGGNK